MFMKEQLKLGLLNFSVSLYFYRCKVGLENDSRWVKFNKAAVKRNPELWSSISSGLLVNWLQVGVGEETPDL